MMMDPVHPPMLWRLVTTVVGSRRADELRKVLTVDGVLTGGSDGNDMAVPRAVIAQALSIVLFADLCDRVPSAAEYVVDRQKVGERIRLDHAAVRTVAGPCGVLPPGQEQVARLLRPLGYVHRETYDLSALHMTGRSWTHLDLPAVVPQWFVSELHPERLPDDVQRAALALLANSRDPLGEEDEQRLRRLEVEGSLPAADVPGLLRNLPACFNRLHPELTERDYDLFLSVSPELAWIATEGTTCNHWTDRVDDVAAVAAEERRAGRPVKDAIEVSASGRVLQTAHRAAMVERRFHTLEGDVVHRIVPGSFFELIERHPPPGSAEVDLGFDAANATGIFAMTRSETEVGR